MLGIELCFQALDRLGSRKTEEAITRGEFAGLVNRPDLVTIFLESGIDVVAILRDPDAWLKMGDCQRLLSTERCEHTAALLPVAGLFALMISSSSLLDSGLDHACSKQICAGTMDLRHRTTHSGTRKKDSRIEDSHVP